ncbi:TonB-dependent receptor [Sphingomonas humi]|uniref:TonB-dependent receptor n=1 Tax=Sphingomonas humi TaxID=335630 RepID=A0ABP7S705_9SPHN
MKKLLLLCSTAAAFVPTAAFAQSTGTLETEKEEAIIVTGTRTRSVEGVTIPDTTKAQAVISQELIAKQSPGQTILNTINLVPGVNFTQNDAFGSSGGNIRIRGFDGNRISLTFDGLPLNDTGNYAIFSNQQLDPELIEQVNVNLGVTDVDSPTASAAGGTINYRTILPTRDVSARVTGSLGSFDFRRVFALINTGDINSSGTRAFVSGSVARNDKWKGPGDIYKRQLNARIYQPIGTNGDFVSVSGHLNINRNNFYRNPTLTDLRNVLGSTVVPTTATPEAPLVLGGYDNAQGDLINSIENLANCNRTIPGPGVQNDNGGTGPNGTGANAPAINGSTANNPLNSSSCSNYFNVRVNPSNTGNIRINSRFKLTDALTLTIDPSFQYTLAHGGGSTTLAENSARAKGGLPTSPGVDFNRDGDFLDTIRFFTPNITNTNRFGLTSSLIFDINRENRIRVAYTYDRGRHKQTGEWGFLLPNGDPQNIMSGRDGLPVTDATGFKIQQRDRLSVAALNQIAGQYIGRFFDRALRVEVGVRRPFFSRELQTFCPIEARGSGFAYCTSETNLLYINPTDPVPATGATPYYRPFKADYKFGKLLPNVGFTYNFSDALAGLSVFGSWAKGFSAPRTDNLYRAPIVTLDPEETDAFDLGARFTRRNVQAQLSAWQINYKNRIVSSFNQDLGISLDRNVGRVDSRGIDANFAWQPVKFLSLIGLVSYIDTELKSNVQIGSSTAAALPAGLIFCGAAPTGTATAITCAPTAGKQVTETPKWQFGGRVNLDFNPVELGFQFKRVGSRFATDTNDIKVKGYTTADADLRFALAAIGMKDSFLQLNVTNLFNEYYFGNISTQIRAADNPNFTPAAPRTFIASLNLGF